MQVQVPVPEKCTQVQLKYQYQYQVQQDCGIATSYVLKLIGKPVVDFLIPINVNWAFFR